MLRQIGLETGVGYDLRPYQSVLHFVVLPLKMVYTKHDFVDLFPKYFAANWDASWRLKVTILEPGH